MGMPIRTGRHRFLIALAPACWAHGDSGAFQQRLVVPKLPGVKAVFAAGNNSFAVKTDGTFWIWGIGERGACPLTANAGLPVKLDLP